MGVLKRVWAARPDNFYRDVWGLALTLLIFLTLHSFAHDRASRARASAVSQVENCQQIEQVKAQLVGAVEDSVKGRHLTPKQRERTDKFLARFAPRDCYALPIAKTVGLKPPRR